MSDRDYIAWSLLASGGIALLFLAINRLLPAGAQRTALEQRRTLLAGQLAEQQTLGHPMEVARLERVLARFDAFVARHPWLVRALAALSNVYWALVIVTLGFVAVGFSVGRIGWDHGQTSLFSFLIPIVALGWVIDAVPPTDGRSYGRLIGAGLIAAFIIPLMIAFWWSPR